MKSLYTLIYVILLVGISLAANCANKSIPNASNIYYKDSFFGIDTTEYMVNGCYFSVKDRAIYCKNKAKQTISIPISYNSGCEYCNKNIKEFIIWEKTNGSYHRTNFLWDERYDNYGKNVQEKHLQIKFSNGCEWNASYVPRNIKIGN